MKKEILDVVDRWNGYKQQKTTNASHPVHELVVKNIPFQLANWAKNEDKYKTQGSDGQGNIATAPWFAVFNRDITESATKEYYLVYLISEDLERLVLEIGFGATQFEKRFGTGKNFFHAIDNAVISMRSNSSHLLEKSLDSTRSRTNSLPVKLDRSGDFRLRAYEHCAIYSLTYSINDLPDDTSLEIDFREYLRLYDSMANSLLLADVEDYVLETFEPAKINPEDEILDFVLRPKKKTKVNGSISSKGGSYRRSKKSDKVGKLGEEYVFRLEKERLESKGLKDLAEKVIWHREYSLDRTPGWDITSFSETGEKKLIEVKTSEGDSINEIILTRKEWDKANDETISSSYFLYLVTNITSKPKIEILRNPALFAKDNHLELEVEAYSLSLRSTK